MANTLCQRVVRQSCHASLLLATVLGAGCGPSADVVLYQQNGAGPAQELHLTSRTVAHAAGDDGAVRLLFAWPLPGSCAGAPMYKLYLETSEAADVPPAGLLVQCSGRRAGCTPVVRGEVQVSGGTHRTGALDVWCEDGTRIVGRFVTSPAEFEIRAFEEVHRADIVQAVAAPDGVRGRRVSGNARVD